MGILAATHVQRQVAVIIVWLAYFELTLPQAETFARLF